MITPKQLRWLREGYLGMTRKDLARYLYISDESIKGWENLPDNYRLSAKAMRTFKGHMELLVFKIDKGCSAFGKKPPSIVTKDIKKILKLIKEVISDEK